MADICLSQPANTRRQPASGRVLSTWPSRCAAGLLILMAVGGCAGYRMGAASMFPADIETVYVPVFESDSYRRQLGERLTEIVIKEIEARTNYKVVNSPDADSILTGRIVNDTKRVVIEDRYDQPRLTQINFVVQVNWVNRKGDLVAPAGELALPSQLAELSQSSDLIPEFGQSVATQQQDALMKLGRQIVGMMETNVW